jgi:transaldolase
LSAFRQHGKAANTISHGIGEAEADYRALETLGLDLNEIGDTLQNDGLKLFADAYEKLLAAS